LGWDGRNASEVEVVKFVSRCAAILVMAFCGAAHAFCIPSSRDNEAAQGEYYDAASDRYYLAWSSPSSVGSCFPPEVSQLAPEGTTRTGLGWTTVAHDYACTWPGRLQAPGCSLVRRVCAFEDQGSPPPASRFYTINAGECAALKQPGSGWTYLPMTTLGETGGPSLSAFEVDPATGACHPELVPIYRFVKTGGRGPRNHRYVADAAVVQQMRARSGWVLEGVAFCVLRAQRSPVAGATLGFMTLQMPAPAAMCDNGVGRIFTCIESDNMPALLTVRRDQDPASPFASRTGAFNPVAWAYTQPFATPDEMATHSFAQTFGTSDGAGFFVTSRDRIAGNVSSVRGRVDLMAELAPFLANYEVDMDLALDYRLFVKRARVAEVPGSEAYVQPLVTLRDERSGLRVTLSPGAIGTPSMADGTFREAATGDVTVFIALGASAIGRSLGLPALRIPKSFDADNAWGWGGDFQYRINRTEFTRALERARAMEPRLSADPADYRVEALSLKGEVAGDSEIGYQVERMELSVVRP
jgi:hypothetical protein